MPNEQARLERKGYDQATIFSSDFQFNQADSKLIINFLGFSFAALFIGALAGLLQTLQRSGYFELPTYLTYYQLLTVHGVMLALIFTTFFIIGFLLSGVSRTLGHMQPRALRLGWISYYLMVIGTVMATITILTNDATVLYTFYAPMQASPWFYVGLALVVVGSWFGAFSIFSSYLHWRKANEGKRSPLFAYMAVAIMILWLHASLAVAIMVVFQLIPWSFGWIDRINVGLSRTLFWYFGHPLVYFWLLPAYIYWYVNLPKIVGGKIFSDSLPRLTFILFILFSIPVGFHHQLNEPGISSFWKFLQVILTMIVVVPSLMTAFSILATFELAGRERGGKGILGWVKKLPWKDARFFSAVAGMILFIPAGASGVVNASYQLNQLVHNTWFVTGHFHLTLAAVVMTFFGIAYWLLPVLTKRKFTSALNRLGLLQTWSWLIGMLLLGGVMHIVGLMGAPRRTSFTTYGEHELALSWFPYYHIISLGAIFLFVGVLIALYIFFQLMFISPKEEQAPEYPIGEVLETAPQPPRILERWSLWIGISIALVAIAYTIPLIDLFHHPSPGSLPVRTW